MSAAKSLGTYACLALLTIGGAYVYDRYFYRSPCAGTSRLGCFDIGPFGAVLFAGVYLFLFVVPGAFLYGVIVELVRSRRR